MDDASLVSLYAPQCLAHRPFLCQPFYRVTFLFWSLFHRICFNELLGGKTSQFFFVCFNLKLYLWHSAYNSRWMAVFRQNLGSKWKFARQRQGAGAGPWSSSHRVSRPCSPSRRVLRSPSTSVVAVSLRARPRTVTAFVTGVALSPLTARLVRACLCDKSSASLSSVHSQSAPHSCFWGNLVFCQTLHSVHFARMRSKDTGGVAPSNLRWGPNSAPDTKALPFSAHHILR